MPGLAVHEVTELAIVTRLKPFDPYFRWFSDGFANALSAEILRRHFGADAAKAFLADYDPAPYADIQHQVNLAYWMGKSFEIAAPIESEKRLTNARYAYATFEARRLIDRHGLDIVQRVLRRAATQPTNDSRELFPAIEQVTGEDMRQRLMQYLVWHAQRGCEPVRNGIQRSAQQTQLRSSAGQSHAVARAAG
jgi:hypothetical protein